MPPCPSFVGALALLALMLRPLSVSSQERLFCFVSPFTTRKRGRFFKSHKRLFFYSNFLANFLDFFSSYDVTKEANSRSTRTCCLCSAIERPCVMTSRNLKRPVVFIAIKAHSVQNVLVAMNILFFFSFEHARYSCFLLVACSYIFNHQIVLSVLL